MKKIFFLIVSCLCTVCVFYGASSHSLKVGKLEATRYKVLNAENKDVVCYVSIGDKELTMDQLRDVIMENSASELNVRSIEFEPMTDAEA